MHNLESSIYSILQHSQAKSILIAVSGGADSVALLVASTRIAPRLGLHIEAVNCNFHLRSEESDRDSVFTVRLCQSLGIRLHALDYDVSAYLHTHPELSLEMACRELRYSDFFRIMEQNGFDRVAVAHNSDDDIETMMLNMLRGSGIRGMKGMIHDNGRVIRPLLNVTRKEIEEYLSNLGIDYITDSSNLSSEFRRNFIRREVLPLLETRWPSARKSLSNTVGILKEEAAVIEDYYYHRLLELSPRNDTLLVYKEGVTIGTVLRFLEPFGGNSEISEEIMSALNKSFEHRSWKLSERFEAILERDRLIVVDTAKKGIAPEFIWTRLEMSAAMMDAVKTNRDHNIIYLPSDQSSYSIRPPMKGDRMTPLGMRGSRLVSDIISDARLDRYQKSMICVLERKYDGKIIWVSGLKRSCHDLISAQLPYCYRLQRVLP